MNRSSIEAEVFAPISDAIRQGEERAMREAGMRPRMTQATRLEVLPVPVRYWTPGELPDEAQVIRHTEWREVWS